METSSMAADLLQGAEGVANFTGLTARQVYHLDKLGEIPTFRLGAKLCARKSTLLQWIEDRERASR